ncbi:MAG: IS256 family transposase [Syntrophaceae bacterium]|nr:IS256 family transposase [Syntrophaceae bacterium]
MKISLSVTELKNVFKEIQRQPERIFEMMRTEMNQSVGEYLAELMRAELSHFLGREPYERKEGETNHRNGSYERRFTMKRFGEVAIEVPRDRNGEFRSEVLPRSKRYEDELRKDICLMYLTGISTRTLSMISKQLLGRKISAGEVSRANGELIDAVERWRTRSLREEKIKYLLVDGVNFSMRVGKSVETVPVLVAVGVREDGTRLVLGLQAGDKESAGCWREFFKDLKSRGLSSETVTLGVMDGLAGLEMVFREEFPHAEVQRCQVHVARNVLAKVPKKLKSEVADDMRSIFYASSKEKAKEFFVQFKEHWEKEVPSAVKCLENSLESCLTFFKFPPEEWQALRTTNIIERLNKEFKRRTKSMEIVAGENACYRLLAFISLKMEVHWKRNPIGKVAYNLPIFKRVPLLDFTQNA